MAAQFPGLQDIIDELLRQQGKDTPRGPSGQVPNISSAGQAGMQGPVRGPVNVPHNFPAGSPSMGNVPRKIGGGVFAESLGGAGSLMRGVGGLAGKAAGPLGAIAFANDAVDTALGAQAEEKRRSNKYSDRLPSLAELGYDEQGGKLDTKSTGPIRLPPDYNGQGAGAASPAAQGQGNTYSPEELQSLLGQAGVEGPAPAPVTLNIGDPNTVVPDEQEGQGPEEADVPPEMLVPATSDVPPELAQLLGKPDRVAPTRTEHPETAKTLADLGKNVTQRSQPKSGFGRSLLKFLVAGSGPIDPTRLDRQEEDLYQAQNRLTEREGVAGKMAAEDRTATDSSNFAGKMAAFQQPMSPQDKILADLLGHKDIAAGGQKDAMERLGAEHGFRMQEIGAGAANQKITPEMQQQKFLNDLLEKYPDIDPGALKAKGVNADPEAISSIRKGRIGQEKPDILQALIQGGLIKMPNGAGANSEANRARAAADKKKLDASGKLKNLSDLVK